MSKDPVDNAVTAIHRLRPGHADTPGTNKYNTEDARDILERSSARESAARVAAGAVCRAFLAEFGVEVHSHVLNIGGIVATPPAEFIWADVEKSEVRCADPVATEAMMKAIDDAREAGDSLGGIYEVVATGLPIGLGTHVQWDLRRSNNAGGLEGGMTTGAPLVIRAVVKPIATIINPLPSIDLTTGEPEPAHYERSDITFVATCGVVAEAMVMITLADAFLEKFGGDHIDETKRNYLSYLASLGPKHTSVTV